MEPFIGQVMMFAGNFAPRSWAFCNGQLLPISQNTALFSLLGTIYGGDGRTTFALPDLRGRVPVHAGTGPGLQPVREGERKGRSSVSITPANLPSMDIKIPASSSEGGSDDPADGVNAAAESDIYGEPEAGVFMASAKLVGGNQPIDITPPSLGINYIIALQGIFPSRS